MLNKVAFFGVRRLGAVRSGRYGEMDFARLEVERLAPFAIR